MKTPYRQHKDARDQTIYDEYNRLIEKPGAMKTAIEAALMKKYKIHSRATIWQICQRVAKRLTA